MTSGVVKAHSHTGSLEVPGRSRLIAENTHPANLAAESPADAEGRPLRIPLFEVYMRMAEELAKRSTCGRLQVGTVVTDFELERVVAAGYNGNARGFPNACDTDVPGACGCIHSEMNALIKAPGDLRKKVVFVTTSPCVICAKLIVQSNVAYVYYRNRYRNAAGLEILEKAGIPAVEYARWRDTWRTRED